MRSQKTRRGIMVLAVLFSLTVLAMLTVVWLRLIAAERQYLKQQLGAQQAELLALSALDRAEARLAADADYAGETWTPEASSLGPGAEAEVIIEIEPGTEVQSKRTIRVVAVLKGAGGEASRVQRSQLQFIPVTK